MSCRLNGQYCVHPGITGAKHVKNHYTVKWSVTSRKHEPFVSWCVYTASTARMEHYNTKKKSSGTMRSMRGKHMPTKNIAEFCKVIRTITIGSNTSFRIERAPGKSKKLCIYIYEQIFLAALWRNGVNENKIVVLSPDKIQWRITHMKWRQMKKNSEAVQTANNNEGYGLHRRNSSSGMNTFFSPIEFGRKYQLKLDLYRMRLNKS